MSAQLTSVRSERVTFVRRLHERSVRHERGLFVVEGAQGVQEALAIPNAIEHLYVTERAAAQWAKGDVPATVTTDEVLAAMSETEHPQGVLAVCHMLNVTLDELPAHMQNVLVLHQANDPGNAGTMLRSADAFGADAVIFTKGSVDVYNGKCIRATAGSVFHLPIVVGVELRDVVAWLREQGMRVRATEGRAAQSLETLDLGMPSAWVIGTEAHGLDEAALELADDRVRIPMAGSAESVNAAVAAGIVLYRAQVARG